jgi:hypothetical protein
VPGGGGQRQDRPAPTPGRARVTRGPTAPPVGDTPPPPDPDPPGGEDAGRVRRPGVPVPSAARPRTGTRLPSRGPSPKALQARRRASHARTSRPRWAEGLAAVSRQRTPGMAGWRHDGHTGKRTLTRQPRERDGGPQVRWRVRATRGRRGHWRAPGCAAGWQGRGVAAGGRSAVCGQTSRTVRWGRGWNPGLRSPAPLPDPTNRRQQPPLVPRSSCRRG